MSARKSNLKVAMTHGHRFPTKFNIYRPLNSFIGSRRRADLREGTDVCLLDGILAYSRMLAYARYEPGQHMKKWTVHLGPPREQVTGTDFTVIKDENSLIFRFSIKTDVANSWRTSSGEPQATWISRPYSVFAALRVGNCDGREKIGMLQRLKKRRKRRRFEFLGTGASGPLGRQWELATIITMPPLAMQFVALRARSVKILYSGAPATVPSGSFWSVVDASEAAAGPVWPLVLVKRANELWLQYTLYGTTRDDPTLLSLWTPVIARPTEIRRVRPLNRRA
ncbi:hypothetical protein DL771_001828 [Monosporascus sp. 5C6A]|nr:hypothetical protein DL771_001828 [Monosporascus sp. 5C6A]